MGSIRKDFGKYISLSILGMLGSSGTILADTFFVSNRLGASGLAALNIAISIFGLINGLGMMLGAGGATRYTIFRAQGQEEKANQAFTLSFFTAVVTGIGFLAAGLLIPHKIAGALGADASILPMCTVYLKTVLCFAPFFILNHLFMTFIRNDGNPKLSMGIMVAGSLANIILDFTFMYPLNMGIFGAALATGLSPVIGLATASLHLLTKRNHFHIVPARITPSRIAKTAEPGLSAFINELSSSIVLVVFNLLIIKTTGNIGVAAYGIVANLALVVLAVFTGISQGIQPLFSRAYGKGNQEEIAYLYRKGRLLSSAIGIGVLCIAYTAAPALVSWFNSEQNPVLQALAEQGLKIYFTGFLFVGFNYLTTALLSATERAGTAFALSFLRGCIGITVVACLLAALWGMTGIWVAFPVVELGTMAAGMLCLRPRNSTVIRKNSRQLS